MWMKAEPIECPHGQLPSWSSLLLWRALFSYLLSAREKHYPSLAWARPTQKEAVEPLPTPGPVPEAGEDIPA